MRKNTHLHSEYIMILKGQYIVYVFVRDLHLAQFSFMHRYTTRIIMYRSFKSALGGAIIALAFANHAEAATVTTTFTVSANVTSLCEVSALPMLFGNYGGVLNQTTSALTVSCTNGTPYNVGLNQGLYGASTTTRQMKAAGSSALLNYSLFQNSGYSINWDDVAPGWVSGTGTGAPQLLTVYGQIPAGQFSTPDAYSDTITVTVNF
ncbi:spore coat U domain-containing protein [Methylosinus sp. LW3]|uniref:Csu type fimbrial protein n=1 Tax=Methylosinus sp. LW3 TaxID=107635 RepID=UPI0004B3D7EA|nr:spore coat U domain-containing protein [Methylosinus sp. LW3]